MYKNTIKKMQAAVQLVTGNPFSCSLFFLVVGFFFCLIGFFLSNTKCIIIYQERTGQQQLNIQVISYYFSKLGRE